MSFISNKDNYKVWVFAPYLDTDDSKLKNYYDYTQSISEFEKVFSDLSCEWEWANITLQNLSSQVSRVKHSGPKQNIVFNLCDGDEINGAPGLSVIHALKANQIPFTGAEAYFYEITTSKITMKEAFDRLGVSTAKWQKLNGHFDSKLFEKIGSPAILKPAVSAGSMGITSMNVVSNETEYTQSINKIKIGYNGWKVDEAGLLAEQFILGREFTVLMVGSYNRPEAIKIYTPIELVFHSALPETEKFLSFDRLWATYEEESEMPNGEDPYDYVPVTDETLLNRIQKLSLDAFHSVKGTGYGRLDLRMDTKTNTLFVLEVNAQCGLSDDENTTSIGGILKYSKKTFTDLVSEILDDALLRTNPTPL
jgi:D-alanine-D-alanine ligase